MLDTAIHIIVGMLTGENIVWRKTCVPWICTYYAEAGIYLVRNTRNFTPSFAFIAAKSPDKAAEWARDHCGDWGKENDHANAEAK